MTLTADLTITKGDTFIRVEQRALETTPYIYKAITAITKAGPAVITSASHGIKAGWRFALVNVGGMREIKSKNFPPRSTDFHLATAVDTNTVTPNDIDSTNYTAFTSGGSLLYYTPISLDGCTARMMIRSTAEEATATTTLESLTSSDGITLDDANHKITILISATDTAAYDFVQGVYDLELVVTATGVVTKLLSGNVYVLPEITR